MDPSFWFNISRLFTLIGGLLTVFGGFGLYHFGHLKEEKTKLIISDNKKEAQKFAAETVIRTRELEFEITESKHETAIANQKTEELKVEVIRAKQEAEKAKQEREKLLKQQRFIKSISVQIIARIPTKDTPISKTHSEYPKKNLEISPLLLSKPDKSQIGLFFLHNYSETQVSINLKELNLNYSFPELSHEIIGKDLTYLEGKILVSCFWGKLIEKFDSLYDKTKISEINFIIRVNGIIALKQKVRENTPQQHIREEFHLILPAQLNNIKEIVLGNKTL